MNSRSLWGTPGILDVTDDSTPPPVLGGCEPTTQAPCEVAKLLHSWGWVIEYDSLLRVIEHFSLLRVIEHFSLEFHDQPL